MLEAPADDFWPYPRSGCHTWVRPMTRCRLSAWSLFNHCEDVWGASYPLRGLGGHQDSVTHTVLHTVNSLPQRLVVLYPRRCGRAGGSRRVDTLIKC